MPGIAEQFTTGGWQFTPEVAEVFPEHVRASVPFYDASKTSSRRPATGSSRPAATSPTSARRRGSPAAVSPNATPTGASRSTSTTTSPDAQARRDRPACSPRRQAVRVPCRAHPGRPAHARERRPDADPVHPPVPDRSPTGSRRYGSHENTQPQPERSSSPRKSAPRLPLGRDRQRRLARLESRPGHPRRRDPRQSTSTARHPRPAPTGRAHEHDHPAGWKSPEVLFRWHQWAVIGAFSNGQAPRHRAHEVPDGARRPGDRGRAAEDPRPARPGLVGGKIAKELRPASDDGHPYAAQMGMFFDHAQTDAATKAAAIDMAARRARIAARLLDESEELLDDLKRPYVDHTFTVQGEYVQHAAMPTPQDKAT